MIPKFSTLKILLLFFFTFFLNLNQQQLAAQNAVVTTGILGTGGGSGGTGSMSFAVINNNSYPMVIDSVGYVMRTTNNGHTFNLYYSETNLGGNLVNFPGGWNLAGSYVCNVTSTVLEPNFQNLNLVIPPNTAYRFAILNMTSASIIIGNTTEPVNSYTDGGLTLAIGNYQLAGGDVGKWNVSGSTRFGSAVVYASLANPPGVNDAGITELVSPVNFCVGLEDIDVTVKNFGANQINNLKVAWNLNGVAQIPYSLNLPLDTINGSGINERTVTLGSHNFLAGVPIEIKAWTYDANGGIGGIDTVNGNDTIYATLKPALSGTYTVNQTAAASVTNYQNFTDLTNDLNNFGICGPVTVNVVSGSGPYNDRLEFLDIPGSSAINTIRINGNGNTVQYNSSSASDMHLLVMDGTKYLAVDNLTFKTLGTTYGWGAILTGGAETDSITNCVFNLTSVTSTSSANCNGITITGSRGSAVTAGDNANNCYIANNIIDGGPTGGPYYAVTVYGVSSAVPGSNNNIIKNNEIANFYYYGIYTYYTEGTQILNNNIHRANKTTITSFYGIRPYYSPGTKIIGNRIHSPGGVNGGSGTNYALYIYDYNGTASNPSIIANNAIYNMNLSGTSYLMYLGASKYTQVYHNTLDQDYASTGTTYGIWAGTSTASNLDIKNNTVSITNGTGTKYGFYYVNATIIGDAQKNNYYINSLGTNNYGYIGVDYATPAAQQAAYPTLEIGSQDVNPQFNNPGTGDFTPMNSNLIGVGFNLLTLVPNDINGISRTSAPTIGAFEQAPTLSNDARMGTMIDPVGNVCATTVPVKVSIGNAGINNISSMNVNWTHNGVAQTQFAYTGTLVPPGSPSGQVMDTITVGTVTLSSGLNNFEFWTSSPNGQVDSNATNDSLSYSLNTTSFTISSNIDTMCPSGVAQLTLNPGTGYGPNDISWQSSTDGGTTWSTIIGATDPSYQINGLNVATMFRAQIATGGTSVCNSSSMTMNILNIPTPTVTNASRCGSGTLTLGATTAAGSTVNWYDLATGGTSFYTGTSYTTPILTNTTTYYVASNSGSGSADSAEVPLTLGTTSGVYHHMFLVSSTAGFTLDEISLKVMASAGTATAWDIYYRPDNYQLVAGANTAATGWILASSTNNVTSLGATTYTTIGENLNITIPAGATYSIYIAPADAASTHNYASSPIGTVTGGNVSGTIEIKAGNRGSSLFNCNTVGGQAVVKLKTSSGCESARVPITASIGSNLVVDLGNDTAICQGSNVTLDAGANVGVTYLWSTGAITQTINVNTSGTYSVTVDDGNCAKSDTVVVSVHPIPVVNLGNDTTICLGSILNLNAGATTGAVYAWNTGANTQNINVTTSGTYIATVTTGSLCQVKDTIVVTVVPGPSVNLGNDTTICQTSTVTLNAGTVSGATYLWNTGATTQTISANTTGSYSVVVNNGSCAATDTINVTVVPKPILNLGNDTAICSGSSVILNPGATVGATYLWSTGATTQSIIVNTAGQYIVTASTTVACNTSDTINVSVIPSPIVNLGNDTAICNGSTISLVGGTASAGMSYLWNTGATSPAISVNTSGVYSVTLTNTLTGCSSSDTIAVSYAPNPTAVLADTISICDGGLTILNAGNNGSNYLWNTGSTTQSITVTTGGQYSVSITNAIGCSINDTTEVIVRPNPIVDLGNDSSFCDQSTITLDAQNPGSTYLWNTGNITQTIVVYQTGVYKVTVTNQYNCSTSDSVEVSYLDVPTVDGFYATPRYDIQLGRIDFEPINPMYVTAYLWDFGDGNSSTVAAPYHIYNTPGNYKVTLSVSNLCGDGGVDKTINVEVGTGINTLTKGLALDIYPVPAQNVLNIESVNQDLNIKTIKVLNILGQELQIVQDINSDKISIDINQIPSGSYLLKIETDKGMTTRRFNIVR